MDENLSANRIYVLVYPLIELYQISRNEIIQVIFITICIQLRLITAMI